jgi:hypothetical protein
MPRINFNSEVMQSSTSLKDTVDKVVCPKPALIFDNPQMPGAANSMLHPYSERSNLPVVFFLFPDKASPFGLFYGLFKNNTIRSESLSIRYPSTEF